MCEGVECVSVNTRTVQTWVREHTELELHMEMGFLK